MSLKIDKNEPVVAYHVIDGPVVFTYRVDAHSAVSRFPLEWSWSPFSAEDEAKARKDTGIPELELTAEDQAAFDEHAKAVAEASERLKAYHEKKAAEKAERDQIAADEEMIRSVPPRPDPAAVRRPFGRKGEPTPAELEQIKKRDAKKAADDKMAADKAEQDRIAAASAGGAKITS